MGELLDDEEQLLKNESLVELLKEGGNIKGLLDLFDDEPDYEGLLEAAAALKNMKPWEYISDAKIFVIEGPATQELIFVPILGAAGHPPLPQGA